MTEPTLPIGDIIHTWTDAEREVWNAWSTVDQDVSRPATAHGCGPILDALEMSVQGVTRLQSAVVHSACSGLSAIPLLPPQAHALVDQACRPLLNLASLQSHLVSAWFGMARHMVISVPSCGARSAPPR
jgi:hypothetical protein